MAVRTVPLDLYLVGPWPFSISSHAKRWNFGFKTRPEASNYGWGYYITSRNSLVIKWFQLVFFRLNGTVLLFTAEVIYFEVRFPDHEQLSNKIHI